MKTITDYLSIKNKGFEKNNYDVIYDTIHHGEPYKLDNLSNTPSTTPSTTRTNSPDIDNEDIQNPYTPNPRDYIINKNVKDTPEGFVFSNGILKWIKGKPTYVVDMDRYFYEGNSIKIYYELYGNFNVRFGFYDQDMNFIEFTL